MSRSVRAIPLAEFGFRPVDPDRNPVRWYLEDAATASIVSFGLVFNTPAEAESYADHRDWPVLDRISVRTVPL